MTIIVFLVDTSASMQQRSWVSGRSTFLDIAKGAVEFFVKLRQKSPESRGDRYMLLTFEEYPRNIKAGWKENLQTFMSELKNLEANGMTTMGTALKQVFDILNINRMQTGIDMYGQGRYPFYLEPAVILGTIHILRKHLYNSTKLKFDHVIFYNKNRVFFCQKERISVSTLHVDKIFYAVF